MEGWINTWIIEPHSPQAPEEWVAMTGEGLFLSFALGHFLRGEIKQSMPSFIFAGVFYGINRTGIFKKFFEAVL